MATKLKRKWIVATNNRPKDFDHKHYHKNIDNLSSNNESHGEPDMMKVNESISQCLQTHLSNPLLKLIHCFLCGQAVINSAINFEEHLSNHQPVTMLAAPGTPDEDDTDDVKVPCKDICKKETHKENKVEKKSQPKNNICVICERTFSGRGNLSRHVTLVHKERRFLCEECDNRFATVELLNRHVRIKHTGERPYECAICETRFFVPEVLRKHMKTHNPSLLHLCIFCGKSFNDNYHLKEHERIHTQETPFQCDKCGEVFRTSTKLSVHYPKCESIQKNAIHKNKNMKIECEVCDLAFETKAEQKSHQYTKHSKGSVCSECKRLFPTYGAMWQHKNRMHLTLVCSCDVCGKVFQNKIRLWEHKRRKHSKPFACTICSRRFGTKNHMTKHMVLHGKKEFEYICPTCGGAFQILNVFAEHLKSHEIEGNFTSDPIFHLTVNKEEIEHQCLECNKTFESETKLWLHKQTHTKPFHCSSCDQHFAFRHLLRAHEKKRHKVPIEEDVVCSEEQITCKVVTDVDFENMLLNPLTYIITGSETDGDQPILATLEFLQERS